MTILNKLFYFVFFAAALFVELGAIENSVVPLMEQFEQIENLPKSKYSSTQYQEIVQALKHKDQRIRLMSYNVLFDLYDHNLEEVNRWPARLPRIVEMILDSKPDIIGVQELYKHQFKDLSPYMSDYEFYARECKDGELNGIFYRKDRFKLIGHDLLYMTTTETISSESLTSLFLKDLKTGRELVVYNTHLAFSNINKRDFQARYIAEMVKKINPKIPVILTGDLNTFPNRLDLDKLPFYDGDYIHRILTSGPLKASQEQSLLGHLGPISTFTNEGEDPTPFKGIGTPGVILDHIYISKGVTVLMHAVQQATIEGHFPSDHMPVLVDFILQ